MHINEGENLLRKVFLAGNVNKIDRMSAKEIVI